MTSRSTTVGRRHILAAALGATTFIAMPERWEKPLTTFGVLPAHAQGSAELTNVAAEDAGVDVDADVDAGEGPDAETLVEICRVTVGYAGLIESRPTYYVAIDIDSASACALRPLTTLAVYDELFVIGFLGGSSGYSSDARGDLEITSAGGGRLSSPNRVDATENQVVTVTLHRRGAPDAGTVDAGDAGAPANNWKIKYRLNGDPTNAAAACTVSLYELTRS